MSKRQGDDEEISRSKGDSYDPKTPAMKSWKKRYLVNEKPKIEKETKKEVKKEVLPTKEEQTAIEQFTTFCSVLIIMSIGGAIFAMIGYSIGPQTCDNDSIFSIVGVLAFFASMVIGIPVNLIIWLFSLTNPEFDSRKVFSLIIIHAGITLICIVAFNEFLLQYLWCGPGGPHYDIGAGF